jgi:hypothetical protein
MDYVVSQLSQTSLNLITGTVEMNIPVMHLMIYSALKCFAWIVSIHEYVSVHVSDSHHLHLQNQE